VGEEVVQVGVERLEGGRFLGSQVLVRVRVRGM
jgi:hypothetical protein